MALLIDSVPLGITCGLYVHVFALDAVSFLRQFSHLLNSTVELRIGEDGRGPCNSTACSTSG